MDLTPVTLAWLLLTLGLVTADREWVPGERSAGLPEFTEQDQKDILAEWLARKLKIAELERMQAEAEMMESRLDPDAAIWTAEAKPNVEPDVSKKWHDNVEEDRELPIGRQVNTKVANPSSDGDFRFAVGPDNPRFFYDGEDGDRPERPADLAKPSDDFVIDDEIEPEQEDAKVLPVVQVPLHHHNNAMTPLAFIAIVAACCAMGILAIVLLGVCSYKLQKKAKAAADVEYPAYGVTGPSKDISPGSTDKRLAHSAQMYHYQHQKQQIIAMERASNEQQEAVSEPESDEDVEEAENFVYECPGLASTQEMEVKNPLFLDDATPASPARHPQELPK